jgi:hypothetical protein
MPKPLSDRLLPARRGQVVVCALATIKAEDKTPASAEFDVGFE